MAETKTLSLSVLEVRWKGAGLRTADSHRAITRGRYDWEWSQHTRKGVGRGREKADPDDIIWATELTPGFSLDWSIMWANKFLFDLIQSALGLNPLPGPEES